MSIMCTMIGRLGDGLLLTASMDDESGGSRLIEHQAKTKQLMKKLSYASPPRASLDAPPFMLHYIIEKDVIYVAICEKSKSSERAMSYLLQVAQEFNEQYGEKVSQATRPYSFIEFDTTLQRIKKATGTRRTQVSNLQSIRTELGDIHNILRDNIDNVLERGAALSDLEYKASELAEKSQQYRTQAKNLNLRSFYAKLFAGGIVSLVVIIYFFVL